ncbi:putative serine protease 47 [Camelus ferus]|uniref:Serine protease 47 n=1 Tax=Camelus ferus TaxID=419612 RepID=A0A8B8S232_CAMFR|nr:putative serine protease 47 [Camelus ferus]
MPAHTQDPCLVAVTMVIGAWTAPPTRGTPARSFPLWSSRGGAGMQAWTSEPAQSSGSWARARCSWTSYPRRNAAWGLGRHFLSPLLPSLVRKSQFLENYRVLLGNTQLYQHTRHTQKIPVSQIIVYPDFDKFHPFGNDIAMLQLLFPVNFTSYIIPACLPAPCMQLPSNSSCWITGWGMLSEERPLLEPFRLQEGKGGLVENKFCNMLYEQRVGQGRNYSVHEEMLCAGDFSTEKAICRGDSGGPLVCNLTDAWVLVGLASWGLDCRHPIYPSVFTNVSYFIDWMDEIQRLTPLRNAMSAPPQTQFPHQPLQAAGSPGPGTGFVSPQPWPLLLFLLQDPRQALW